MTYLLSDDNFRQRFHYHLDNPIASAEQEVAILGAMIEQALNSAVTPAEKAAARRDCEAWLVQRANLRVKIDAMKIRANEVYTKGTVEKLLLDIVQLFKDHCPESTDPDYSIYSTYINALAPKMGLLVHNMRNPEATE